MPTTLWYRHPATDWMTQALPIGCGRLAAMLFGGLGEERLQFNEESLWIGDEQDTGAYQAFGDVVLALGHEGATDYRRELDLARAVHTVRYVHAGVAHRREAFASAPAGVIALRLTCDTPEALATRIRLTDAHQAPVVVGDRRLQTAGSLAGWTYQRGSAEGKPVRPYRIALSYAAQVRILTDGSVDTVAGGLHVTGASTVTLLLDAGTDFVQDRTRGWRGAPAGPALEARLNAAAARSWDDLLAEHVADHRRLFARMTLDLEASHYDERPTDEMLAAGSTPALDALLFHYGRYLLIASSRAGGLPANLQGKWNQRNDPEWRCDYHTDINVQMNYWAADPANLGECFEPYARWLDSIRAVRTEDTHATFGAPGWIVRAECGLFGGSTWEWIPGCSAWLVQNSYDHVRFTGDLEHLRRFAYPAMREICSYWLARLIPRADGSLITPRGFSPEHGPEEEGVAFDHQLVWDLFTSTAEAAALLGVDEDLRTMLRDRRDRLIPPRIGRWGQLQEWQTDRDDPQCTHRHLSHLLAVFPGRQISPRTTPELAVAARISLEARGDHSTGWSSVHKLLLWARLHDGDRAHRLIRTLMTPVTTQDTIMEGGGGGLYANLLCAHPPFQIDGNLGYVAGVCELLVQSHLDEVHLLPALPSAWPAGQVTGLRARGGLTVDLAWAQGRLVSHQIWAATPRTVVVRVQDRSDTHVVTASVPAASAGIAVGHS